MPVKLGAKLPPEGASKRRIEIVPLGWQIKGGVPLCKGVRPLELSRNNAREDFTPMPVKLGAKLPPESAEARIEIVPLIDIMFFLLAAFMLVSLSMVNMKSVKVNLPTATSATAEMKKDYVDISVEKSGAIYLDKKPMADNELVRSLASWQQANPKLRVYHQRRQGRPPRRCDSCARSGPLGGESTKWRLKSASPIAPKEHRHERCLHIRKSAGDRRGWRRLCSAQWRTNSRLDALEAIASKQRALDQAARIADREKRIAADTADLEQLRMQLAASDDAAQVDTGRPECDDEGA